MADTIDSPKQTGYSWIMVEMVVWRCGSALNSINEVNLRWVGLVLRWMTVSEFDSRCGTFISVCNQPLRSTESVYSYMGRHNEYGNSQLSQKL